MNLERIEIVGFRGIKRLSLPFDELTTLIGENTWGKSSLLDALSIALRSDNALYSFNTQDFHVDYAVSQPKTQSLQIILTFITTNKGEIKAGRYRRLKPLWIDDEHNHGNKRIFYRISAEENQRNVTTLYSFLDANGEMLAVHHPEKLAQELMSLHPVLRLKDTRQFERSVNNVIDDKSKIVQKTDHSSTESKFEKTDIQTIKNTRIEKRLNNTYRRLMSNPGKVNKEEIQSCLNSMNILIDHYFSFKKPSSKNPRRQRNSLTNTNSITDRSLSQIIQETTNKQTRLLLMGLLNTYVQAKGPTELRKDARPLLIIEDPESRLHPTHLARAWSLLELLPMQKILTTNNGALLRSVPLHSIRRLARTSDKTEVNSVPQNRLSRDELRRVAFHVRFHRSEALFARCWLLVEGETEVWLFNELAQQCGYNLMAEGVQIIEFAQSGLKSLIKVAQALGIDWHVVTDGDQAGKKYAMTVHNLLHNEQARHRLTELPDKDIEHFLYTNGFEPLFRNMAKISNNSPMPPKKIIARVLKKYAKPDVALAIVSYCEEQGMDSIPLLLRWTLNRVVSMAKGHY